MCSNCKGPHTSSAKDCPVWQKEKEIQCVRVDKRMPFPEARQLVEASLPSVLPARATLSYSESDVVRCIQSVEYQTDLSWVSSDIPVKAVSIFGRPGSASAGTQASSGSTGPASADAWVLLESASEKSSKGSADPLKKSATGSAPVNSAAGLSEPDKSACKGLADPLKTVNGLTKQERSVRNGSADRLKTALGALFCAPKIPVKKTKGLRVKGIVVSSNDLKALKDKKTSQKTKGWAENRPGKCHNNPVQVQNQYDPIMTWRWRRL